MQVAACQDLMQPLSLPLEGKGKKLLAEGLVESSFDFALLPPPGHHPYLSQSPRAFYIHIEGGYSHPAASNF